MISLVDLEVAAAERIEPAAFDYIRGGSDDELTLADNRAAWQRFRLRPRVLRGEGGLNLSTTVLGTSIQLPVITAPVAYHMLANPEGESGTARGAAAAGTVMIQGTLATQTLEEVAAAAPEAPRWFQVYILRDRGWTAELAVRAKEAGYRALVLTVDVPVSGRRRRDERNSVGLPAHLQPAHQPPGWQITSTGAVAGSSLAAFMANHADPAMTVDDIAWLRDVSGLPVVVKGVLRADDAAMCVDAGAAAVGVSNHGGRQLDTAIASADALPEIVDAVAGRVEVYVDGGIRTGTDVLKAIALGARAVLIGRPVIYGLALDGWQGVAEVLGTLSDELRVAMTLCGAVSLADLTPDLIVR